MGQAAEVMMTPSASICRARSRMLLLIQQRFELAWWWSNRPISASTSAG
jgi:hypothetical protein